MVYAILFVMFFFRYLIIYATVRICAVDRQWYACKIVIIQYPEALPRISCSPWKMFLFCSRRVLITDNSVAVVTAPLFNFSFQQELPFLEQQHLLFSLISSTSVSSTKFITATARLFIFLLPIVFDSKLFEMIFFI